MEWIVEDNRISREDRGNVRRSQKRIKIAVLKTENRREALRPVLSPLSDPVLKRISASSKLFSVAVRQSQGSYFTEV